MAGAMGGAGAIFRERMLGVNRIVQNLKTDESRAAVLGAAVDQMAKATDLDPGLSSLASKMREVITPSKGEFSPLQNPRLKAALLQSTVNAAISGLPMGAGVVLALAARSAADQDSTGEGTTVLHRALEQIAANEVEVPGDQSTFLAKVALAGSQQMGNTPSDAVAAIERATIDAIADQNNGSPVEGEPKVRQSDSDALVNDQLMYCKGKSPERVRNDMAQRLARFDVMIGTKASKEQFESLKADPAMKGKNISFDEESQVLTVDNGGNRPKKGLIVEVMGGPQDRAMAEEAGRIAEAMGNQVERISAKDIESKQELLKSANVVLTVCGEDAGLTNAVAALTDKPVIAMPTKSAFGDGLQGSDKLIQYMQGAADGVSFVNIENGFGAAYLADKINRNATAATEQLTQSNGIAQDTHGYIVVTTAGSADIPVAEKAALAAEALGERVVRLYDHGVNDPDGLKKIEGAYKNANAVIVAAGLEGGLPNHVAAITQSPVVAVPTSVGYGTGQGGVAAMLCALNACSPGIVAVAIDAAVKAAQVAHKISSHGAGTAK